MDVFDLARRPLHGEKPGYWSLAPVCSAAPASYPVELGDVKAQLRVDSTDDDDQITNLIGVATAKLDGWSGTLGRCLMTQSWKISYSRFWHGGYGLRLPLAPVQSVTTVTYYDKNGDAQTLDADGYRLLTDARGGYIALAIGEKWPETAPRIDAVTVEFVTGYGDADDVPAPIRQAITVLVQQMYDKFADPDTAKACLDGLLDPYRKARI